MKAPLARSIRTLTLISGERSGADDAREQALTLACYPLVGLAFFGFPAFLLLRYFYQPLPLFAAWFVICFWFALSGGKHVIELYRAANALFFTGTPQERLELLSKNVVGLRGVGLVVLVLIGKILAIIQGQFLDSHTATMLLLLTPTLSRYAAAIMVLTSDAAPESTSLRTLAVFFGSLIVLLACGYVLALGVLLVVVAMAVSVLCKVLFEQRLGVVKPIVSSVVLELSEVSMLWAVVISGGFGLNLALL